MVNSCMWWRGLILLLGLTQEVLAMDAFSIQVSNIAANHDMASKYTCEGQDISPALQWQGVPLGTKSLALIVDDPDAPDPLAPKMTWVHWVMYNLPVSSNHLKEGIDQAELPVGALFGLNDWRVTGYRGPCPPIGKHRYFFKLYALDTVLPNLHQPTKQQLEAAMQGHVLAKAEMVVMYQKQHK